MSAWEILLLATVTCAGGSAARFLVPDLDGGRLLMVLGLAFTAAVAMLFASGYGQWPMVLPVPTVNGPFRFGWGLLGGLGGGLLPAMAIRRRREEEAELTDPGGPTRSGA